MTKTTPAIVPEVKKNKKKKRCWGVATISGSKIGHGKDTQIQRRMRRQRRRGTGDMRLKRSNISHGSTKHCKWSKSRHWTMSSPIRNLGRIRIRLHLARRLLASRLLGSRLLGSRLLASRLLGRRRFVDVFNERNRSGWTMSWWFRIYCFRLIHVREIRWLIFKEAGVSTEVMRTKHNSSVRSARSTHCRPGLSDFCIPQLLLQDSLVSGFCFGRHSGFRLVVVEHLCQDAKREVHGCKWVIVV